MDTVAISRIENLEIRLVNNLMRWKAGKVYATTSKRTFFTSINNVKVKKFTCTDLADKTVNCSYCSECYYY